MKKFLPTILLTVVLFLISASNTSAATTAGPVGLNGLRAFTGPERGQITLEWARVTLTGENYTIRCGTQSGWYPLVYSHVGYIASYTVSNLTPGQRYYCVLERIQTGDVSIGWMGEVSQVAGVGMSTPVVSAGPTGRNHLTAVSNGNGEVTLTWMQFFADTSSWHLVFGTKPGSYQWGALNIVRTASGVTQYSYTVKSLPRGTRVYFALVPVDGAGNARYITAEVSTVVR